MLAGLGSFWRLFQAFRGHLCSLARDPFSIFIASSNLFLTLTPSLASLFHFHLWWHQAHLHNPASSPHLKVLNSIPSAKSLLPLKGTYLQASGTRTWTSLGTIVLPAPRPWGLAPALVWRCPGSPYFLLPCGPWGAHRSRATSTAPQGHPFLPCPTLQRGLDLLSHMFKVTWRRRKGREAKQSDRGTLSGPTRNPFPPSSSFLNPSGVKTLRLETNENHTAKKPGLPELSFPKLVV